MDPVSREQVLEALRDVVEPASGRSIVAAEMIDGLIVKDGHVQISIAVDPAAGSALEPMRQAAEKAMARVPGVLSATAILTAERQPSAQSQAGAQAGPQARSPAPSEAGAARPPAGSGAPRQRQQLEVPGVKAIIAVASGKGGVGKSTVAVNLALGLQAQGLKAGLLDADIYGPSAPRLLGISGKPSSPDGKRLDPKTAYGLKVMSIGFLIEEDTPMIWRGPMVQSALVQMLRDVNWGDLDVLVVDMPPGTGDAQLTMAQQVPLSGAVIVSTPQDIALIDARKGLNMFLKVNVPVLGIVENMSYFLCPHCGERSEVFGHGGAREEAARLGVDFLGEVPLHLEIRIRSDAGTPIVASAPDSAEAGAFRAVAARVAAALQTAAPRAAPRIVVD
ncbi:MAG: iron-sulfur cluster carrier protein ApbC [Azospirillaceae bacterium]